MGRETTRTLNARPNTDPVTLTHAWDPLGHLTDQHLTTGNHTLRHRAHTYRADGYLASTTHHHTGDTTAYELDAVGRPLTVSAENWSESYAYDAAGRTTVRRKTRLSHKPDIWRYTYNAEDQLTSCTTPDGTVWTYTYDPLGRRTAKHQWAEDRTTLVASTTFSWDGTRLAEQTDTTTGITLTWDHQDHRPLTQLERKPRDQDEYDSRFFAIVTDLVGTPTELVDETGHLAWYSRTTLWGTTTWNRDATAYTPSASPANTPTPKPPSTTTTTATTTPTPPATPPPTPSASHPPPTPPPTHTTPTPSPTHSASPHRGVPLAVKTNLKKANSSYIAQSRKENFNSSWTVVDSKTLEA